MRASAAQFRNAEYRRSLLNTLEDAEGSKLLGGEGGEEGEDGSALPPIRGKIKVKLTDSMETEVDASAYMAELRKEVSTLRDELASAKAGALAAQGGGLLAYMQGLGRENVQTLTSSISQEVLEAMRALIENILSDAGVAGESFMETSNLKLRELLVWQLITGYKLRELEAKEELNRMLDDEGEAPPEA